MDSNQSEQDRPHSLLDAILGTSQKRRARAQIEHPESIQTFGDLHDWIRLWGIEDDLEVLSLLTEKHFIASLFVVGLVERFGNGSFSELFQEAIRNLGGKELLGNISVVELVTIWPIQFSPWKPGFHEAKAVISEAQNAPALLAELKNELAEFKKNQPDLQSVESDGEGLKDSTRIVDTDTDPQMIAGRLGLKRQKFHLFVWLLEKLSSGVGTVSFERVGEELVPSRIASDAKRTIAQAFRRLEDALEDLSGSPVRVKVKESEEVIDIERKEIS